MENKTDFNEVFDELFKYFVFNKNITRTCNISKFEAKKGTTKKLEINHYAACSHCRDIEGKKCNFCSNQRFVGEKEVVTVNIPKKTKNNDTIIMKGLGNKLEKDKERGDLYIKVHVWGENR